jgi:hypothetical protein
MPRAARRLPHAVREKYGDREAITPGGVAYLAVLAAAKYVHWHNKIEVCMSSLKGGFFVEVTVGDHCNLAVGGLSRVLHAEGNSNA